MTQLHSPIWVPLFDALAEPSAVVRLAVEAEEAGWDGVLRVGSLELAGTHTGRRGSVDCDGGDRGADRTVAGRADGDAGGPAPAGEAGTGDATLEILKAAWTGDPVDHQGKH